MDASTSDSGYRSTNSIAPGWIGEKSLRRIALVVGLMLVAYLVGFVPAWLTSNGYELERDTLRRQLKVAEVRRSLASAALHASEGRFEDSLSIVSGMFDELKVELGSPDSSLNAEQREWASRLLATRDEMIASLARHDPIAADRLSAWYFELAGLTPDGTNTGKGS